MVRPSSACSTRMIQRYGFNPIKMMFVTDVYFNNILQRMNTVDGMGMLSMSYWSSVVLPSSPSLR